MRVPLMESSVSIRLLTALDRLDRRGVGRVDLRERTAGQVVVDRVRQHEVAVGQALHQRARAEPVGAVVGEVGLAGHEQPGDGGLQVVVDPRARPSCSARPGRSASASRTGSRR